MGSFAFTGPMNAAATQIQRSPQSLEPGQGKTSKTEGSDFSRREIATLQELSLGKSNKEISTALEISVETVKYHLKNIQLKLGVSNRVSVVVKAIRLRVIAVPEACADEASRARLLARPEKVVKRSATTSAE